MSSELKDESAPERRGRAARRGLFEPLGFKIFDPWSALFQPYRPELRYMRGSRPCEAGAPDKTTTRRRG